MLCNKCNQDNFVSIKKEQSNKEKRNDKQLIILVCKNCDPLFSSLSLLSDGYDLAVKSLKFNQEDNK